MALTLSRFAYPFSKGLGELWPASIKQKGRSKPADTKDIADEQQQSKSNECNNQRK